MNYDAQVFAQDVLWAIGQESQATPNSIYLTVAEILPHQLGVQVRLEVPDGNGDNAVVDERFRNAHVYGAGLRSLTDTKVKAFLDPDLDDVVVLVGADPQSVYIGQHIEIRAYNFFVDLLRAWNCSPEWTNRAYERFVELSNPREVTSTDLRITPVAGHLQPSQSGALHLAQQSVGFCIGPAGTGKTETCAVMLAAFMMANPKPKILLVGVANFALDQLLERLDQLLKEYGRNDLRQQITRYGPGFSAPIRVNCPHFFPGATDPFIPGYAHSRELRFDEELQGFDPEKKQTRLFAMTVSTAIKRIASLRELAPFDFCLVEEASQASLAHVIPLAAVSNSIFCAGDPAQLSPVAKHHDHRVRKWMAASPFSRMPDMTSPAVWMLTEQRRMADSICRLVSDIAYTQNPLVTAPDVMKSKAWMGSRHRGFGRYGPARHLIVHAVPKLASELGFMRERQASIDEIVTLLNECRADGFQPKDVMVITPFRDQARRIKRALAKVGIREVTVSTVHRTQGSAKKVVIFDVVDGRHPFLQTDEAKRLLTVAFSRAEAKLLVLASSADLIHPILKMADAAATQEAVKLQAETSRQLLAA